MAVKQSKQPKGNRGSRKNRQRAAVASRLAPEEEWNGAAGRPEHPAGPEHPALDAADPDFIDGSLIFEGEHVDLPRQLLSTASDQRGPWLDPVLIVVLTITLSFTVVMAYLISIQSR